MALLFSAVTATANNQEIEFLVGGIPRELDDLEGWIWVYGLWYCYNGYSSKGKL